MWDDQHPVMWMQRRLLQALDMRPDYGPSMTLVLLLPFCVSLVVADPSFTTGPVSNSTGQNAVPWTAPPSFTSQAPGSFTSGSTQVTTGQATSFTAGSSAITSTTGAPIPVPGACGGLGRHQRNHHGRDGTYVGRFFVPGPDAPPPPPSDVRDAYIQRTTDRVAAMEAQLAALKERVFAFSGEHRDALAAEVDLLAAERNQWAAALGSLTSVDPASFNAAQKEWDAGLAGLDARAKAVSQALAAQP